MPQNLPLFMSAPGEDAVVDVYSRTHLYNRNVESYAMKIDRSNVKMTAKKTNRRFQDMEFHSRAR